MKIYKIKIDNREIEIKQDKDGKFIIPDEYVQGRFPANLILSYPEDSYILKDDITPEQKEKVLRWLYENA